MRGEKQNPGVRIQKKRKTKNGSPPYPFWLLTSGFWILLFVMLF
jgi:hypothetical protein